MQVWFIGGQFVDPGDQIADRSAVSPVDVFHDFIFQGIGQAAPDLIILGAIPIIVMALVVDGVMRAIVRAGTPRGLDGGT